jgi:predicted AAA+ superfamily ATPase
MKLRKRFYDSLISEHLRDQRQMALISGPRQVGKTTVCRERCSGYLNWDNIDDRRLIMAGPGAVAQTLELDKLRPQVPVCLFDELHKFSRWKQFLKGFFDTYADQVRILITGSSRMDVYRRGGDSLMGRYFLYRMHPFSVAEAVYQNLPDPTRLYRDPKKVSEADFTALWTHGGYPEPFLKRDMRFSAGGSGQCTDESYIGSISFQQSGQSHSDFKRHSSAMDLNVVYAAFGIFNTSVV